MEVEETPSSKAHSRNHNGGPAGDETQKHTPAQTFWIDAGTSKAKQYYKRQRMVDYGGEYLVHWYAGIIDEHAVSHDSRVLSLHQSHLLI